MSLIRRYIPSGLAMLLVCVGTRPIIAQASHLDASNSGISGQYVQAYTNQWEMIQHLPDSTQHPSGRWIDTLEVVVNQGREMLRRTQVAYDAAGNIVSRQVHIVDRLTMAPLRSHLTAGKRIKHVDFGPDEISGFVLSDPNQAPLSISGPVEPQVFDFEIAGTLLVAFAMEPGDEKQFLSYELLPTGFTDSRLPTGMTMQTKTVVATALPIESVYAGALGEVDAMPVVVERGNGPLTFWLAKTPPYVVKLTSESPTGTTIWIMQ